MVCIVSCFQDGGGWRVNKRGLRGKRSNRLVYKYTLTKIDAKSGILLIKHLVVSVVSGFYGKGAHTVASVVSVVSVCLRS